MKRTICTGDNKLSLKVKKCKNNNEEELLFLDPLPPPPTTKRKFIRLRQCLPEVQVMEKRKRTRDGDERSATKMDFLSQLPDFLLIETFLYCINYRGRDPHNNDVITTVRDVHMLVLVSHRFHNIMMDMFRQHFSIYLCFIPGRRQTNDQFSAMMAWFRNNAIQPTRIEMLLGDEYHQLCKTGTIPSSRFDVDLFNSLEFFHPVYRLNRSLDDYVDHNATV